MLDMLLLVVVVFSSGEDVDEDGGEMDFFLVWLGEMCRTWPQVLRQDLQRPKHLENMAGMTSRRIQAGQAYCMRAVVQGRSDIWAEYWKERKEKLTGF